MMTDLRTLERAGLVDQLAAMNPNARPEDLTLGELIARGAVRLREIEAERDRRRHETDEKYRRSLIPRPVQLPKPEPNFAQEQLLALARAIARGVVPRFRELEKRVDALAPPSSAAAPVAPGLVAVDPIIANYVRSQVAPAEALARRVHALEQDAMQFRGVWDQDLTYARGSVVTYAGGTWFALETNNTRPGTDGSWKLTVKAAQPPRSERGTNR